MTVPERPKIYHIVHVDRLPAILEEGFLLSDAEMAQRSASGTTIGMHTIKQRRLYELTLKSHPNLYSWRMYSLLLLPPFNHAFSYFSSQPY